jgi:two-component sensor histidine kinase
LSDFGRSAVIAPSQREVDLEAEVARLRVEVARLQRMAAAATGAHDQALADSIAKNLGLSRANASLTDDERRHMLLLAELNHRVKNILFTVQGLASHTLKGTGGDPRRFAQHFGARLRTLARAHDMLTELGWDAAGIEDATRKALAPWLETSRAFQISISEECGRAKVSPRQAQALVLGLHELATNAVKYGALSVPAGRVSIDCKVDPDGTMTIRWKETEGPLVAKPPDRRGFGTRLLERGLAQDLGPGSVVELHFDPSGLCAVIHFTPAQVA